MGIERFMRKEKRQEGERPVRFEFETEGDIVYYRPVFEGGRAGAWAFASEVHAHDPNSFRKFKQELFKKHGIAEGGDDI